MESKEPTFIYENSEATRGPVHVLLDNEKIPEFLQRVNAFCSLNTI